MFDSSTAVAAGITFGLIIPFIIIFSILVVCLVVWLVTKNSSEKPLQIHPAYGLPVELAETKSIAMCILLYFVTFGIYSIYWSYSFCRKIRLLNNGSLDCLGELLCILFVPFYNIYWMYTRGKKLYEGAQRLGIYTSDNSTPFLLLSIFGFGIVAYALMQNDFNTIANELNRRAATQQYPPQAQPQQPPYPPQQ